LFNKSKYPWQPASRGLHLNPYSLRSVNSEFILIFCRHSLLAASSLGLADYFHPLDSLNRVSEAIFRA
jgi:hypothetical protein